MTTPWKIDAITAGSPDFNTARMKYVDPEKEMQFQLEWVRMGSQVDLFLISKHFPFHSEWVTFQVDQEPPFEAKLFLFEGRMKMKVPTEIVSKLIGTLQDEKKVDILVDGMKETLRPHFFIEAYAQFMKDHTSIQHLLKGPLQ